MSKVERDLVESVVKRRRTSPEVDVYDQFDWDKRHIVQRNYKDNTVVFDRDEVEIPSKWGENAGVILATKYMRRIDGEYESSLRQVADRICDTITRAGVAGGYFTEGAQADSFNQELKYLMLDQRAAFNTPVWFNIGVPGVPQAASACFILQVDDNMDSILDWFRDEAKVFLGGSGAGVNLSEVRSSQEKLSSGVPACGPLGFMRSADSSAGVIKSGTSSRRAAKMVLLDADHPDIEEFIWCKAIEGRKASVLNDAGYDMDLEGNGNISVQYQNANNSVRVTDEFMRAALTGKNWDLKARTTGETLRSVPAAEILDQIAQAAWECADPGMQYHDTINRWHTLAEHSPIVASNPCSEFLSINYSACNLASLNLLSYLSPDRRFDHEAFRADCQLVTLAMEILVGYSDYPVPSITENANDYRQLGLGYTNLGALLMCLGLPYDSEEGRNMAAALFSALSGSAYLASSWIAQKVGPYPGYDATKVSMQKVLQMHSDEAWGLTGRIPVSEGIALEIARAAHRDWLEVGDNCAAHGVRNSQASVAAPTGTISFVLGTDTTGIEPDFSLTKFKKLVGGSSMIIINAAVSRALDSLGYSSNEVTAIGAWIKENGDVVGAPHLAVEHYPVFDCAVGRRSIEPMGHVKMLAALQPFVSGALSKTINLPNDASVDEIRNVYVSAWQMGCKAIAVYRDGSKMGQPLSSGSGEKAKAVDAAPAVSVPAEGLGDSVRDAGGAPVVAQTPHPMRQRLPRCRAARTTSFRVSDLEGYLTMGEYPDGRLGELFLKVSKQGSTLSGIMDSLAVAVSIGLQYGVPLETYVAKYTTIKFEPAGMTDDSELRIATSVVDYIFRYLAVQYLSVETRQGLGVWTSSERGMMVADGHQGTAVVASVSPLQPADRSAISTSTEGPVVKAGWIGMVTPICNACGVHMTPSGACFACPSCGSTSGCS